jgi:TolB-like protein/Flp pilus assembly protein TadD
VNPKKFLTELKRRNVYKVAIAYAVVAWLLMQVASQIFPFFEIPNWAVRLVVLLLVIGFPVAMILAWAFELTPEGIKRAEDVSPNESITPRTGRKLIRITVVLAVIAAALVAFRLLRPKSTATVRAITSVPVSSPAPPAPISEKSIAVLPFENLSDEKQNAYFADGVQDQILTNLSKVSDLKVISHTSVRQYRSGVERNIREIGQQLGVSYILEGSVQRAPNRLRVMAQLIDARNDSQLWAESYDRDAADLFAIQSDLAQSIVGQLQARLSPEQKAQIEEFPTRDLVAYELYRQGKEIVDSYLNAEDVQMSLLKALQALEQATQRDPNFVLAYCCAARAHDLLYFFDLDPTPARILLGETAAKTALRLRPNSPEAHFALADHYFRCHRDYDRAQQELAIARPGLPNNTPFFILSGYINRRRNHWPEAERDFATAVKLDPHNPNAYNLLSDTCVLQRRYGEAIQNFNRRIAAGDRNPIVALRIAGWKFVATGDVKWYREALAKAPPDLDVGGGETPRRVLVALVDHDYAGAERVLAASPRKDFQDIDFSFYYPKSWYEALIARAKGDRSHASAAYSSARLTLQQRLVTKPEDARTLAVLAQADAQLGRKELAIREALHAVELMPVSKDIYDGALVLEGLAQVYTWTDERDRAIELVQKLSTMPGYINYAYLKWHPAWDPLRSDPRFEAIIASLAPKEPLPM